MILEIIAYYLIMRNCWSRQVSDVSEVGISQTFYYTDIHTKSLATALALFLGSTPPPGTAIKHCVHMTPPVVDGLLGSGCEGTDGQSLRVEIDGSFVLPRLEGLVAQVLLLISHTVVVCVCVWIRGAMISISHRYTCRGTRMK